MIELPLSDVHKRALRVARIDLRIKELYLFPGLQEKLRLERQKVIEQNRKEAK